MKISLNNNQFLKILYFFTWFIFIGLLINTGGFIWNTVFVLLFNGKGSADFWNDLNFQNLFEFNKNYFLFLCLLLISVSILKTWLFFTIENILNQKKLNFDKPFQLELYNFVLKIMRICFFIALVSIIATKFTKWLVSKSVVLNEYEILADFGTANWLFISIILLVIAKIIKKGIDLQTEIDLTI